MKTCSLYTEIKPNFNFVLAYFLILIFIYSTRIHSILARPDHVKNSSLRAFFLFPHTYATSFFTLRIVLYSFPLFFKLIPL